MSMTVTAGIRQLVYRCRFQFVGSARTIMTSPTKLEKALENLQKNPYYDKYADRISTLQRASPQEFIKRVERQQGGAVKAQPNIKVDTSQYASVLNPKDSVQHTQNAQDVKLETIFKVDLVKDKTSKEIQTIWEEYHKHRDVISATIPAELYSKIHQMMIEYPTFIFPLPRSDGYEFIMCQISGNSVHFTPLLAYQVHAANAPECLTMRHYTELTEKGLVLMRGDYDQKVISGFEAQCLANQFQLYYGAKDADGAEVRMLRAFTRHPDSFRHMELVERLENAAFPH